jgi:integrase
MTQLSDHAVRQARPAAREYLLKDGAGLFLRVKSNGAKTWVFRYYWHGKQEKLTFGKYPDLSLKNARQLRDEARETVTLHIDPRQKRRMEAQKQTRSVTFREFVQTWLTFKLRKLDASISKEKKNGGRQGTAIQIERYLRLDMLPSLGNKAIADITRADLLEVQRRIEARGALSIAEKIRSWLNEIFRHAIAEGLVASNPAAEMDVVALPYRRTRHNPFLTMAELPELFTKLRQYTCNRQTELGIRLLLLTGVRQGELRFAEPGQFDLRDALWKIPPEDVKQLQRVKREKDENVPDYLVPLPRQAVEIVEELLSCMTPAQRYLLGHISQPKQAISENTVNTVLKRMGFQGRLTGHGIRATLSTALNELGYNRDWIEAQLSHSDKDRVRASYNHAKYLEQRRRMMQEWADRLDALARTE